MFRGVLAVMAIGVAAVAQAGPPRVATDIAPVHSIVAAVMAGVGEPALILPPSASPHGFAMRPSQARALAQAQAVFWTGPALIPWFGEAVEALAPGAVSVTMADAPGAVLLPARLDAAFAAGGHAAPVAGAVAGAADAAALDGHLWLDPANAAAFADLVAGALATLDPGNAPVYGANAAALKAQLAALSARLSGRLAGSAGRPFVVFHDAYQYFEARFGLTAVAALSLSDAAAPGAARLGAVRGALADSGALCVFTEPQFNPALARAVVEGGPARLVEIDPLGLAHPPGPGHYAATLTAMAEAMAGCLEDRPAP